MILAHAVPTFATRVLSGCTDEEDGLVAKVGMSKKSSTISLLAAVRLEYMLQAQLKRRSTNFLEGTVTQNWMFNSQWMFGCHV